MQFELSEPFVPASKRIAVIGAGISGLAAAHLLAVQHRVTLFEAEGRLGGHARTVWAGKRGDQAVDTGFIVFNQPNYPHLCRLFAQLDVPIVPDAKGRASGLPGRHPGPCATCAARPEGCGPGCLIPWRWVGWIPTIVVTAGAN